MKQSLKVSLMALGCLTLVAACEVKPSVEAEVLPPDRFSGKARVEGPKVEGVWQSPCMSDGGYASSRFTLTFTGAKFERKNDKYTDQYCQTLKETDKAAGEFIFSIKYKDESYNINYAIDEKNGWTQFVEEKILLENDVLYTSRFLIGEDAPLFRNQPLKLNGWVPSACENYAGNYESTNDKLQITQNGCELLSFGTSTYLPDGFERYYSTGQIKASFFNKLFRREYRNSMKDAIMEQWSFQTRPCNIVNPSNESLLTKEIWINGAYSYNNCAYYNRTKK